MTEEKKASEKILERMDTLETTLKTLIESHPPHNPQGESRPAHQSIKEMAECKDCYPKMREEVVSRDGEQIGKDYMKKVAAESKDLQEKEKEEYAKEHVKKVAAESKDLQFECVGCGKHFEKGKKECPNCHGTDVRSK